MGAMLFTWICAHGMSMVVINHRTRSCVLPCQASLCTTNPSIFRPNSSCSFYGRKWSEHPLATRASWCSTVAERVIGGQTGGADRTLEIIRASDERAKRAGKAGTALLVVCIRPPEGNAANHVLRCMPVVLAHGGAQSNRPDWMGNTHYITKS
ncbi:hypothetical protein C8R47DRAFT_564336 [Mycena vitilis]|nr:hypothetical protein C8R47DRAFT_564336 [Mycena vitilis]